MEAAGMGRSGAGRTWTAGPGVALAVVVVLALSALGPVAQAHKGLIFNRWTDDRRVEYDFTRSIRKMPAGSTNRIKQGANDWNKLGTSVRLVAGREVANYAPRGGCPTQYQKNAMHYLPIDGPSGILGIATVCSVPGSGEIHSMQITFDSSESWYTGTGMPPEEQIDLWSVASHEFGHTLGIEHFESGDPICIPDERETMCPFYSPTLRIPAEHDRHGLDARY